MKNPILKTIQEARNEMRPLLKEGTICECCGQRVQLYVRSITSSMVRGLIMLSKATNSHSDDRGFIHIQDFFKQSGCPSSIHGDVPKMRFWGFIEPDGMKAEDGNPASGMYKVTERGHNFVNGKILVRRSVKIYNNKSYGFEGPEVDIFTCIKNKFSYSELMGIKAQQ